jgi:hypothetical protein
VIFSSYNPLNFIQNAPFEQFCYNDHMTRGRDLVEDDVDLIRPLLILGFSSHEIGAKLHMPQRTVNYRMAKFGLVSRFESHIQKKLTKEYRESGEKEIFSQ